MYMIFYMQIKEKKYGDSVYKNTVSGKKTSRGENRKYGTHLYSVS